jgi:hypothetical protein
LLVGALSSLALLAPGTASAEGFESCGNIEVSAEATCTAEVSGGCTAKCTPVNFELSCEAKCDGTCSASISGECTASCQADCSAQCEVDPGSFDCQGYCEADCSASCAGHCEADANSAECQGRCEASCGGECKASCNVDPPEANCEAQCQASCSGTCEFEANAECNIECNGSCVAELTGGCQAQCEKPEGAVFCDGEYVDAGNNAAECFDAIEAALDIEGYAHGDASCEGGTCTAEGEAGCSCGGASIANAPPFSRSVGLAGLAVGLGLLVARRRKKSQ